MTRNDQERIVREYCATLQDRLLRQVKHFPEEWDGFHVRALVLQGVEETPGQLNPRLHRAQVDIVQAQYNGDLPLR